MADRLKLSRMADPASFEQPGVETFLAAQLRAGRLSLVLGAGASFGFSLPNWETLTTRAAAGCGCTLTAGQSLELQAEDVWRACEKDDPRFSEVVRRALYDDFAFKTDFAALAENPLMRALGAMAMPSQRGSVSKILSFNFDDLLERYLEYSGFVVNSVAEEPSWDSASDVSVYHLHGLLPSDRSRESTPIVFAPPDVRP